MLSMVGIKERIRKRLQEVGYDIHYRAFVEASFNHRGHGGSFCVSSANARRFVVEIKERCEDGFRVPCREERVHGRKMWVASQRFGKRASEINKCVDWIASAHDNHMHLYEALHATELPLPEAQTFGPDEFIITKGGTVYPSTCRSALAEDIVSLNGRRVVHSAYNPGCTSWFKVLLEMRGLNLHIVTDGDVWHPLREVNRTYQVDEPRPRPPDLYAGDLALIRVACNYYTKTNLGAEGDNE